MQKEVALLKRISIRNGLTQIIAIFGGCDLKIYIMKMKKMRAALAAMTIVALTFTACSGDDGEQGPAGPAGAPGNANVNASTFAVTTADWVRIGNSAISRDTLAVASIDQSVVDNGAVHVYQRFTDSTDWNALPFRYLTLDASGQSVTNANVQATYGVGEVSLSFYTDDRLLATIPDMDFKVVVIPSASLVDGIDANNYEEVKMVYGIEEYDLK